MDIRWVIFFAAVVIWIIVRRLVLPGLRSKQAAAAPAHRPKRRIIKNRSWAALRGLTVASTKMYFRNRTALFFSLFFPIVFIVVFGYIFKNTSPSFKIDVVYQARTAQATAFVDQMKQHINSLKFKEVSSAQAGDDLDKGGADLTLTIPADFATTKNGKPVQSQLVAHYNKANPQTGLAAVQIVTQFVSAANDQITRAPKILTLKSEGVNTKNLSYIDFLLPGMVGLSIMQLGIFSVAFAFVSYKSTGMLRRLQATPVHPGNFLVAQGVARIIMAVAQSTLLITIGVVLFQFHLAPASIPTFILVALLGSGVFMAFGFAIAGWAKNEEQAQPVAQLIQFPMMFLSGTFFSREGFPHLLQTITGFLPLTYLA
ncbi:MAG TPA: ABC transporter permease, partial [Candidatus Saccharimonadia bacterium]|nr:ABC transporter permease [Candidatus Saccharimonadia bacterium]